MRLLLLLTLPFLLIACAETSAPVPTVQAPAPASVVGLPKAGDTIRIIHPANDKVWGEIATLTADGVVEIDRKGQRRTGTWMHGECGLFSKAPCTKIESRAPSGLALRYGIYADGTRDARPSSNAGWKWQHLN